MEAYGVWCVNIFNNTHMQSRINCKALPGENTHIFNSRKGCKQYRQNMGHIHIILQFNCRHSLNLLKWIISAVQHFNKHVITKPIASFRSIHKISRTILYIISCQDINLCIWYFFLFFKFRLMINSQKRN